MKVIVICYLLKFKCLFYCFRFGSKIEEPNCVNTKHKNQSKMRLRKRRKLLPGPPWLQTRIFRLRQLRHRRKWSKNRRSPIKTFIDQTETSRRKAATQRARLRQHHHLPFHPAAIPHSFINTIHITVSLIGTRATATTGLRTTTTDKTTIRPTIPKWIISINNLLKIKYKWIRWAGLTRCPATIPRLDPAALNKITLLATSTIRTQCFRLRISEENVQYKS